MEYLDIVDETGTPTGTIVSRTEAHRQGILHRTAHVWLVRKKEGKLEILLQKRSDDKDSFPGRYDKSSAGHIPAGVDYIPSALRELKEELGVDGDATKLVDCGMKRLQIEDEFYGERFIDNQISKVFVTFCDKEAEEFQVQREEVSEVRWFLFDECVRVCGEDLIPNCIDVEELMMVKNGLEREHLW